MDDNSKDIFEIFGVYMANCFWNTLYDTALTQYQEGQFNNLHGAYKTIIERYARAFCAADDKASSINKYYLKIIKDIHINYKAFTQSGETLIDFIDSVSRCFLPIEYYKTLSKNDPKKDDIFRKIITKSLMKFTLFISQEEINKIIDPKTRDKKFYVIALKKKFISILTHERNEFSSLLMAQNNGIDIRYRDEIQQLPKEVFDKLQIKIKECYEDKAMLIEKINGYVKYINILKKIIKDKDKIIDELEEMIDNRSEQSQTSDLSSVSEENDSRQKSAKMSRSKFYTHNKNKRFNRLNKLKQSKNNVETDSDNVSDNIKNDKIQHEPEIEIKALEDLKQEEYSGDEFDDMENPKNVEEVELPDAEFAPDE